MAIDQTTQDYRLPCGRDIDQLWDRLGDIADGHADEHEATCPFCSAAVASLLALRSATSELVADTADPPAGLTARIMSAVRAEARRGDVLPLPTGEPGGLAISAQAVAAVVRFAADQVTGVRARRCRITVTAQEPEVALHIDLHIAASYQTLDTGILGAVRDRVHAAAAAQIGVRIDRLDVTVDDFHDA